MDEWIDGWRTDGWLSGCADGRTDRGIDVEWMEIWMVGSMD